jgi:hypothetical protein
VTAGVARAAASTTHNAPLRRRSLHGGGQNIRADDTPLTGVCNASVQPDP